MKKILPLILLSLFFSCKSNNNEESDKEHQQKVEDSIKKQAFIQDSIDRVFAPRKKQLTDSLIKHNIDSIINSN
jgi:hypothetical protein